MLYSNSRISVEIKLEDVKANRVKEENAGTAVGARAEEVEARTRDGSTWADVCQLHPCDGELRDRQATLHMWSLGSSPMIPAPLVPSWLRWLSSSDG